MWQLNEDKNSGINKIKIHFKILKINRKDNVSGANSMDKPMQREISNR